MKTRDKIAHAALRLFNEKGERHTTTNHIATDLQISPGNLYYHYQNKQEIIRDIFSDYSVELLGIFSPLDEQQEVIDFKHYLDSIFSLMWKYRFLYSNLPQLLQQDELLHKKYLAVQYRSKRNLKNIFKLLINLKLINLEEQEIETIVTSLHLIVSSWISYQSSMSLKSDITEQVIRQGMLQMTAMLKPFSTKIGKRLLLAVEEEISVVDKKDNNK